MNPPADMVGKVTETGEFILNEYVGRKHNLDRVGSTVEDRPKHVEGPTSCPHCAKPLSPIPPRTE